MYALQLGRAKPGARQAWRSRMMCRRESFLLALLSCSLLLPKCILGQHIPAAGGLCWGCAHCLTGAIPTTSPVGPQSARSKGMVVMGKSK